MKNLYLLRHAKAADREAYESDYERPLAKRGIAACKAISTFISVNGLSVDRVYCSPAKRTRETLDLVKDSLGDAKTSYQEKLYLIDASDLIEFIGGISNKVGAIMIVGHNPGMHLTALRLTNTAALGRERDLEEMTKKFPTGALCSLHFDAKTWRDVAAGGGTLNAFIRPRDLD